MPQRLNEHTQVIVPVRQRAPDERPLCPDVQDSEGAEARSLAAGRWKVTCPARAAER